MAILKLSILRVTAQFYGKVTVETEFYAKFPIGMGQSLYSTKNVPLAISYLKWPSDYMNYLQSLVSTHQIFLIFRETLKLLLVYIKEPRKLKKTISLMGQRCLHPDGVLGETVVNLMLLCLLYIYYHLFDSNRNYSHCCL